MNVILRTSLMATLDVVQKRRDMTADADEGTLDRTTKEDFRDLSLPVMLLGSQTVSVRALSNGRRVCRLSVWLSVSLSRVRSRKLSELGAKFRHLYRK